MGKGIKRGLRASVVVAVASAVVTPMAFASSADPYADNNDGMVSGQADDWNNLGILYRVAGPNRIDTAIKLNKSSKKEWSDTVIIGRDDIFADSLAAGPLADVLDAPIYLSAPGDSIDARVISAITGKKKVVLLGGTSVFSEKARAQLQGLGFQVQRQRGIDRYETAVGIARRTAQLMDNEGVTPRTVNAYLATGVNFPDALTAGTGAADNDGIVLLTKDGQMTNATYDFLQREARTQFNAWNHVEIHTVGAQAEAAARSSDIEDIKDTNSGADRYATAAMVFSKLNRTNKIVVASGESFQDGVVAGAWVSNHDGGMLLTKNTKLPSVTKAQLKRFETGKVDIVVVGGTGSVARSVTDEIGGMLQW